MILVNGKKVAPSIRTDGTLEVNVLDIGMAPRYEIDWKPISSDDILALIFIVDAIRRMKHSLPTEITLVIWYLPYGRADRVFSRGDSLSLRVICDLINNLKFDSVQVYDAHSPTALALLNNCSEINLRNCFFIRQLREKLPVFDMVIAPDNGSVKKLEAIAKGWSVPLIAGNKYRDDVGHVHYHPFDIADLDGKTILVADDICDGGTTFVELAKALKNLGCPKLYLYVTHGIFSNGLGYLLNHYEHIVCHHVIDDDDVVFELLDDETKKRFTVAYKECAL